nr:aspartate dehydrogenase domain-containing protein [uncultured Cohaesibacter sp.]
MSKKQMNIGVIGAGTIGRSIIEHISKTANTELAFILDPVADPAHFKDISADLFVKDPEEALERDVDLVIEAAMPAALAELAPKFLKKADFCGFSCTALSNHDTEQAILTTSRTNGTRFFLPHGAILALDGIADGRAAIDSVSITTTKSGPSLGRPADAEGVLFEGSTREACSAFPRNVNVHAAVALAGLGFDRTQSRIVAVPGQKTMEHRIDVKGAGLEWTINVSSRSLGGVTGAYTPLSAIGSISRILGGAGLMIV